MYTPKKLPPYLLFPLLIISVVSLLFIIQKTFWHGFIHYGIYPRQERGLPGIILSNFIHQDLSHWFNNVVSFFIMGSLLFYYHREQAWKIILWGSLFTGILTWIIGRPDIHIGMSGLNYVLFAYLIFTGLLSRHPGLSAISLIIIFLYGGFFWLLFPLIKQISWEAHLSGFLVGIFFSIIYISKVKEVYKKEDKSLAGQEDNDFVLYFDEQGNFIENNTMENEFVENS